MNVSKAIPISVKTAAELTLDLYGIHADHVKTMGGFCDANFYVKSRDGREFTLKILNTEQTKVPHQTSAVMKMMKFLCKEKGYCLPAPLKTIDGELYNIREIRYECNLNQKQSGHHLIRLQTFLPGDVFDQTLAERLPYRFYYSLGESIAELHKALQDCPVTLPDVPLEADRWNLINLPQLRCYIDEITCSVKREVFNNIVTEFEENVLPNLPNLRTGIIHGDLNHNNLILSLNDDKSRLSFIDYGDANQSLLIFDLAIALTYFTCFNKGRHIFEIVREIMGGYCSINTMTEVEKHVLRTCICGRFVQEMVLGFDYYKQDPSRTHAIEVYSKGWSTLNAFYQMKDDEFLKML